MKYGLIGEHLPHSFSCEIHAKIADYEYELYELTPSELDAFMKGRDFCAINVTIPYKQAVIPYLDEIDPVAAEIGAVNTIVNRDGRLFGYNTDFFGMKALADRIGVPLRGKKVLILGTGGTSKTAAAVALSVGAAEVVKVGRSSDVTYENVYDLHGDAEYIINTTPCGMYPNENGCEKFAPSAVDISCFPHLAGVLDAVYNPLRTNIVLDAQKLGVPAEGGLYMLVAQAVKAAEIFTDKAQDSGVIDKIYSEMRSAKENIVLIGMPGCGKSTVGESLAAELSREFIDTDHEIVKYTGKQIPEIFAEGGEGAFREIESEIIGRLTSSKTGAVISTGGGAVLREDNVRRLKRNGRIYFINRSIDAIAPTSDRPLSSNSTDLHRLYEERRSIYHLSCDFEIVTDENIKHTVSVVKSDFSGISRS